MELEHELTALAAEVAWPATPSSRPELSPPGRDVRRPLLAAAVVALAALASAFAVPQSRGAILRFVHLGGVTVRFVDTLPAAQERPLAAGLGRPLSTSDARAMLDGSLLLPPTPAPPSLHANGEVVSLVFREHGKPVLLSEARTGSAVFLKKVASESTTATWVQVGGEPALWLSGGRHVVLFPRATARLAGDVLLWQHGPLTLRLEGRDLTQSGAVELARSLR
jgi:hypothetical protein